MKVQRTCRAATEPFPTVLSATVPYWNRTALYPYRKPHFKIAITRLSRAHVKIEALASCFRCLFHSFKWQRWEERNIFPQKPKSHSLNLHEFFYYFKKYRTVPQNTWLMRQRLLNTTYCFINQLCLSLAMDPQPYQIMKPWFGSWRLRSMLKSLSNHLKDYFTQVLHVCHYTDRYRASHTRYTGDLF